MATARVEEGRLQHTGGAWLSWLSIIGAIGVASAGGIIISRAWGAKDWYEVWIAGLMLAIATLMAIEGMQKKQASEYVYHVASRAPATPATMDTALPRIGEILLYKYHLIGEKDLKKALDRQSVTGQRLGEILVEMKKLTWFDLAVALEDQISYGDPWKTG